MPNTSLFINPKDEIKITIWIGIQDKELVGAIDEKSKFDDVEYKAYYIAFREPNYRDISELSDKAMTLTQDGEYAVGVAKVRMVRVKRLLKRWDLKDDQGKAVATGSDEVDSLNPVVAFTIATGLENALGIFEMGEAIDEEAEEDVGASE